MITGDDTNMILGNLNYPSRYGGLGTRVLTGLKFLSEHAGDFKNMPAGHYEIDADNIFYEVSEFYTVPAQAKFFEAHRKYIDIQVTISGEEWYGHAIVSLLREEQKYSDDKDIAFYSGEGVYLQTPPGHFILFMPEDAHKPGVFFQKRELVKKIVMKVKI